MRFIASLKLDEQMHLLAFGESLLLSSLLSLSPFLSPSPFYLLLPVYYREALVE